MLTIRLEPSGEVITARRGARLREVLQSAEVLLDYPCGGKGSCRQCRVLVSPPPESGKGKLAESEIGIGMRLACQITLETDCTVTIPEARLSRKLWKRGGRDEDVRIPEGASSIRRLELELPEPTLEDQRADWERLSRELKSKGVRTGSPDTGTLEHLSRTLRRSGWAIETLSEEEDFLWARERGGERVLGFAVDLGTTTVDMALVDLESGRLLGRSVLLNRQASFGADVISRAESFAADGEAVRKAALDTLAEGAALIFEETGSKPAQILKTVVVGNPIMIHIFHGLDPRPLTFSPYIPAISAAVRRLPRDFPFPFQCHGSVESLPIVSAYIGADTVGMIASLGLDREKTTSLAIDIGTNGEIVLARDGRILATSTAAGPAFEGAQISCGMRALEGAIYGVSIVEDGTLVSLVVGGGSPEGICGTGLVSAVAQMLDCGVLDSSGRLSDPKEVTLPPLSRRLCIRDGEKAFVLDDEGRVFITQTDVRKLQLAKGAIRAGIETLLEISGLAIEQIDAVRLAGKFGAGLDATAAMRIGLIPPMDSRKVEAVGNAALRGAVLCLLSREHARRAWSIAERTELIELGARRDFPARFADAMMFPAQGE